MFILSAIIAICLAFVGVHTVTLPVVPQPPSRGLESTVQHIPVLLYHHIDDQSGPWHVPRLNFEQQMAYLAQNNFNTITMADYTDAFENNLVLPDKTVVLTFDDGYDDAYTNVYPTLKQYGFKATFFIITGKVGQPGFLTWDEITEMHSAGMEMGGHTVNHPFLTKLKQADAYLEMLQSRLDLQLHLGVPVGSFAYPYNDHDAVLLRIAALAGFKSACIADPHTGDPKGDIFAIPRITISEGESMSVFQLVTSRGYQGLAVMRP